MRVPPDAPADDLRAALRARGGKTSFELSSRRGFARIAPGMVAYLGEDAQTQMVMGGDGELLRAPLRDNTSSRERRFRPPSRSA